jgi:cytochrome subunit of sulfide dehydrogenase
MKKLHRFGRQLAIAAILSASAIPDVYSAAPNGAALAESCAVCHGTDTNPREGFENLRGEDHLEDLLEMKYRAHPESIMDHVARTYTDAQLTAISNYFRTH